jgi:hypothetical protein
MRARFPHLQIILKIWHSPFVTEVAAKSVAKTAPRTRSMNGARAFWLKELHRWHWISAGLSLAGMLLFAITGITLNHAGQIPADPVTVETTATLPAPLLARLEAMGDESTDPVPDAIARWVLSELDVSVAGKPTETAPDEVYVALKGPGSDGWVTIDRATGEALRETTTRGWVAYVNDLHKGRDTGRVWFWFIDVFAVACIVFTVTGLTLLWLHARTRASTWPLVGLGIAVPVIIALIFIH